MSLKLFCLVLPDDTPSKHLFPISINEEEIVGNLKNAIKQEQAYRLKNVDAHELILYRVKILDDDNLAPVLNDLQLDGSDDHAVVRKLRPSAKLSKMFPNGATEEHLEIIVQVPDFREQADAVRDIHIWREERRGKWLKNNPQKAPSDQIQAKEVLKGQRGDNPTFAFSRPPSAAPTIPIALYHKIFGQFYEDCEQYEPTPADHSLALQFSQDMSCFYDNEDARVEKARATLKQYGLEFQARKIGTYTGTLGGADPLFQAGWHYVALTRQTMNQYPKFNFPCLIIYLAGAYVGFAGVVWTDHPHLEILSPVLPLCYHSSDLRMRMMTARCFGAAKKAIRSLEQYYITGISLLDNHEPLLPYPCTFTPLSVPGLVEPLAFSYVPTVDISDLVFRKDKLVFRGKSGGEDIFIKFARRYSQEAHQKAFELGFAPQLRGFEKVVGGWHMVIMDYLNDAYEELFDVRHLLPRAAQQSIKDEVSAYISSLHEAGFVHGDIRDTNVLVKKDGGEGIFLIDFDWAGKISEARYPMNLNRTIERPEGAVDGAIIMPEHDMFMVNEL